MTYFQRLTSTLSIVFLSSFLSGCTIYDHFTSQSRIERSELTDQIAQLRSDYANGKTYRMEMAKKLEIIGHGAGSYRHYPMEPQGDYLTGNNWSWFNKAYARDISVLLDQTFTHPEVNGVEIDVHTPLIELTPDESKFLCEGNECLFIAHNKPDWKNIQSTDYAIIDYFRRNTLNNVLENFVDKKHFQTRKIFIELKSDHGCFKPDQTKVPVCSKLSKLVANQLKQLFQKKSEMLERDKGNSLSVVSFSATAIQVVRENLGEFRDFVDYALIAGTYKLNPLYQWASQLKGPVPELSKDIEAFIINNSWVNRVWFSAQGVANPNEVMGRLHNGREKHCPKENQNECGLSFSVASYPISRTTFQEKVGTFIPPLSSIMIDIDDSPAH